MVAVLLGVWGGGARAEDQPGAAPGVAGTWLLRVPELEMVLELRADGHFTRRLQTGTEKEEVTGSYKVTETQIVFTVEGEGTMAFQYQLVDANTLRLVADDGTGFEVVRQSAALGQGSGGAEPVGDGERAMGAGGGLEGLDEDRQTGMGGAGSAAPGEGRGALDDAVPEAVMELAQALVKPLANPAARAPGLQVPGWQTVHMNTGWFMCPPDWTIEQSADRFGVHLKAPDGLTQLWFAALDQLPGLPTPEQMLTMLLRRTAGNRPVLLITRAVRPSLIPTQGDAGQEHIWTGRWVTDEGVKTFFRLSVLILARSPAGTVTPVVWSVQACPEAQAPEIWKDVFAKIEQTQVFPPYGNERGPKPDRDRDGVPDDEDGDPDDPEVQ